MSPAPVRPRLRKLQGWLLHVLSHPEGPEKGAADGRARLLVPEAQGGVEGVIRGTPGGGPAAGLGLHVRVRARDLERRPAAPPGAGT